MSLRARRRARRQQRQRERQLAQESSASEENPAGDEMLGTAESPIPTSEESLTVEESRTPEPRPFSERTRIPEPDTLPESKPFSERSRIPEPVEPLPEPKPTKRLLRRRRRGRITCLLGMFIGFAGLIAGRLGVLWIHFDVFAQFTLHFGVLVAAFLIGYLMPRGRVLTAISVIVIALAGIGLWPHLASQSVDLAGAAKAGERTIRLMSFNTRLASRNADAIAEEVLRNDPDIAILVEFGENKREALQKLKARYPHQADCFGIADCHMAIVSKAPFANVESRGVWEGPPLIRASFGPELAGLTVIGIHTIRFPHQRAQLRQIEELSRLLDQTQGPRVVAGDFNATPYSRILSTFGERTRMTRLTILPAWPAHFQLPQLAIDHIFVSSGIRTTQAARIGRNAGSDHYPVIVGLAVSGT